MRFLSRGGSSSKEAGGAEVFVDFGPMDAVAATAYLPVGELGRSGVNEARKPDEGNDDGAAIDEIDGKSVGRKLNRLDSLSRFTVQSVQSIPPEEWTR